MDLVVAKYLRHLRLPVNILQLSPSGDQSMIRAVLDLEIENVKPQDVADDTESVIKCPRMNSEDPDRPTKRRRLNEELSPPSCESSSDSTDARNVIRSFCDWPDDIIIHLLSFLDLESLENFDGTCKRAHFFVRQRLKRFLEPAITSLPLSDDIQHLLQARSDFRPVPPRSSFGYYHLIQSIYKDFETIATIANPLKRCPRQALNLDVDYSIIQSSTLEFFRRNYCYYFSKPIESISHFWTIFWEYKRAKASNPVNLLEKVAKWAWDRYSPTQILGVARFNGCYYSRIITSSLNCQQDALKTVLEIYKARNSTHEIWSVNNGSTLYG